MGATRTLHCINCCLYFPVSKTILQVAVYPSRSECLHVHNGSQNSLDSKIGLMCFRVPTCTPIVHGAHVSCHLLTTIDYMYVYIQTLFRLLLASQQVCLYIPGGQQTTFSKTKEHVCSQSCVPSLTCMGTLLSSTRLDAACQQKI